MGLHAPRTRGMQVGGLCQAPCSVLSISLLIESSWKLQEANGREDGAQVGEHITMGTH